MYISREISVTVVGCVLTILGLYFVFKQIWRIGRLCYYASKFEGPRAYPLIGNAHLLLGGCEAFIETAMDIAVKQPIIYRFWLGIDLIIINGRPEDLEILLNTYLEKAPLYKYGEDFLKNGLLAAPVGIWKDHRKIINQSFNTRILNSFIQTFAKSSNVLTTNLKEYCGKGHLDLIPEIWKCTLNAACETLADIDSSLLTDQDEYIARMIRAEKLMAIRLCNFMYAPNLFWKYSTLGKEMRSVSSKLFNFIKKVIETRKVIGPRKIEDENNYTRNKLFLNHFLNMKHKNGSITDQDILEETQNLLITGSETTALTMGLVLMALSVHTDIQEKIYKELYSVFGESNRDATLDDVNRMEYLERVIKETMRLLPVVPIIMRQVDKDITIDSYVYPKGSMLLVPIIYMNRNPQLWSDPLVFNPDRFLSEEVKNHHRCTFIPFSFGVRNCIGFKYGMLSMKVILSSILRHYKLSSIKYKSINEIKMYFHAVLKPRDGCQVFLARRK